MAEILQVPPKEEAKHNSLTEYFDRRHVLVHGERSGIGAVTALCGIKKLLETSERLVEFSRKNGHELFTKIKSHQQIRCGFTGNRKTPKFEIGQTCSSCPGGVAEKCILLANKEARGAIRKNLRMSMRPVQELVDLKDEDLLAKVHEVAGSLGIDGKPSVKRAIHELERAIHKKRCERPR